MEFSFSLPISLSLSLNSPRLTHKRAHKKHPPHAFCSKFTPNMRPGERGVGRGVQRGVRQGKGVKKESGGRGVHGGTRQWRRGEVWSETREREHHRRNRGKRGGGRVKLDLYSGHEKWRGGGRESPTDREIGSGEEGQRYISQGVQSMYCLLCNTLL